MEKWVLPSCTVGLKVSFMSDAIVQCFVYKGSMAEAAGFHSGSLLVTVEGVPIAGLNWLQVSRSLNSSLTHTLSLALNITLNFTLATQITELLLRPRPLTIQVIPPAFS